MYRLRSCQGVQDIVDFATTLTGRIVHYRYVGVVTVSVKCRIDGRLSTPFGIPTCIHMG